MFSMIMGVCGFLTYTQHVTRKQNGVMRPLDENKSKQKSFMHANVLQEVLDLKLA